MKRAMVLLSHDELVVMAGFFRMQQVAQHFEDNESCIAECERLADTLSVFMRRIAHADSDYSSVIERLTAAHDEVCSYEEFVQ